MMPHSQNYRHCVEVLRQSPLFCQVGDVLLEEMMRMLHYQTPHKRDTSIVFDGNTQFYLIVSGRAKVSVCLPATGREHVLSLLGPGDGFDLVSLLDGKRHETISTALEDMEVLATPLSQAREWINDHPDFNRTFLPYVGSQMRLLANQAADLALYDTESRLARLILRYLTGSSPVRGLGLINDLSQETIASMIGSVRIVVSRHLQNWKRERVISGGRGRWSVDDLQALLKKAEGKA